MMNNPSQQTFRSPEVRVVEASAGSGKTYALAKRYVQLLLNPRLKAEQVPIRNILAITFTNKAAFEMKARILEFLKKLALGGISPAEAENILAPIGIDKETASQKAYGIMETLIHNYNFFQVKTIDSFINALLSGCAFRIGLTANFKIKTNSAEYLEYSLAQLIDKAPRDKGLLKTFDYFLHNYLYLENRTGWFPKEDMLAIVGDLFKQSNTYGHSFKVSQFSLDDLIKKKKVILKQLNALREDIPEGTHAGFRKSLDKFLIRHVAGFDIDSVSEYLTHEEFPVRKDAALPKKIEKLWSELRENLRSLCEEEAWSLFNPYIQVFAHVRDGLADLSAKDDVLFLEELNKRAGLLFDEDYITVEELYYRLATRFHHYLIDEFQDTSRLQWHNMEKMVEEALSTGGSLFYVGDRKQAIYGFRGGDVDLFDDIKRKFESFNVQVDFLNQNWRSQKSVVEFNNAVFSGDNLRNFISRKEAEEKEKDKRFAVTFREEDVRELLKIFQGSRQTCSPANEGGYVRVEYIDLDRKEEREDIIREKTIALVRNLRERFPARDIAILTRSNLQVEQLTSWLLEERIAVDSERTSNIKENFLIQELVAFLKFLNSPIDNLAFASFILGDIFTRAASVPPEEIQNFMLGLRHRWSAEKDLYLYTEFRKAYPLAWEALVEDFFRNVGLYPLYELVVSIYHRFDCLGRFPEYQGFLMHFLELIKKQEDEYSDIGSFLDYFEQREGEDLYVQLSDEDAVKILTVHKAKGLEFPVVILPFLGMEIQVGSAGSDHQQSYILQQDRSALQLMRLKSRYIKFSSDLYAVHCREYKKSFLSELNSIYVALTRAQKEMYAFIPKRVKNGFNPVKFLIPEDIYESGQPGVERAVERRDAGFMKLPCSEYQDWIQYLKDEFMDYGGIRNRDKRQRGEVLHFLLSCLGNLRHADIRACLKKAGEVAAARFPQVKDWAEYLAVVEQVVMTESVREFFFVPDGEVHAEREVISASGLTKRMDRVIVKDDQVWVIDYKSTEDDPRGRDERQVQEYQDILREIYPRKASRGFLLYLDRVTVKEVLA
ncbi:MAG: UvrD-helicase domain-containing protein [Candidatus Omnitrophota bacterium]